MTVPVVTNDIILFYLIISYPPEQVCLSSFIKKLPAQREEAL